VARCHRVLFASGRELRTRGEESEATIVLEMWSCFRFSKTPTPLSTFYVLRVLCTLLSHPLITTIVFLISLLLALSCSVCYSVSGMQHTLQVVGEPPEALQKARLDNIALVPASLLPLKSTYKRIANNLPSSLSERSRCPSPVRDMKRQHV